MAHLLWSEDRLREFVLSLHLVGPRNQTQVLRSSSKHLNPLILLPLNCCPSPLHQDKHLLNQLKQPQLT